MKKFLLSSFAVLSGTTMLVAGGNHISKAQEVQAKLPVLTTTVQGINNANTNLFAKSNAKFDLNAIKAKKVGVASRAEETQFMASYNVPVGTYFFALSQEGRGLPFWYNAPFCNLTWAGLPLTSDGEAALPAMSWDYTNFSIEEGNYKQSSSDQENIQTYFPALESTLLFDVPTFTLGESSYSGGTYDAIVGGNGYSIIYGGHPRSVAQYGFCTYNPFEINTQTFNTYMSAGTSVPNGSDDSWNSILNSYWLTNIQEDLKQVNELKVKGFAQFFEKPASPIAISSMTLTVAAGAPAGTKLDFTFYKVNDEGELTDEVLYTYEYFTGASETEIDVKDITIEFNTEDELGDIVDYKVFDSAMMMVISGYENFDMFRPALSGYDYFDDQVAFGYPGSLYVITDVTAEGIGTIENVPFSLSDMAFYIDQTRTSVYYPATFVASMDLEYPYVRAIGECTIENNEITDFNLIDFNNATDVWFNMTNGQLKAYELVYSAETIDDISYTFGGDGEQPSWIDLGAQEMTTEDGEPFSILFIETKEANETGKSRECTVTFTYKESSTTFRIHQSSDMTGIDNVTAAEAAELDWNAPVYNVMGQKVSQGYTGIAIQNGKKFIVK